MEQWMSCLVIIEQGI